MLKLRKEMKTSLEILRSSDARKGLGGRRQEMNSVLSSKMLAEVRGPKVS